MEFDYINDYTLIFVHKVVSFLYSKGNFHLSL